jgi:hypothetical protein
MGFLGIGGDSDAVKSAKRALGEAQGVRLPNLTPFQLEELKSQGLLSPEQYEAVLQEKSAMEGISTDPALRTAQMDALASLQDLGKGGLTLQDKANLARIQSDQLATSRGQQEAIQQQAAARGVGGSGVALMAQMQAAQDAASRRSQSDLDVAGMAQNRALQALQQGGQLAGNIRGQQFGEQAQIANARDQIANFNAQARNQAGLFNVGQRADTARLNLAERQRIADTNVGQRNLSQQMKRDIAQQNFGNRLQRTGLVTNALGNLGQVQAADSAGDMGLVGGLLGVGGTLGAAAISKPKDLVPPVAPVVSDEREKEEVEHFDAGSFLDELVPSKYKYKDDKSKKSEVGVMAQDLEKAGAEGAVSEDQEGRKQIDYGKMGGTILASLAGLNERLNKLEGGA